MSLDLQEAIYRIILTAFLMPVLLSGLLIWFLVFYQKKKYTQQLEKKDLLLKQQNLIIENQQAIEKERNRIASEMHDDLGSGLTTIKYLSERALKQAKDPEEEKQVKRISEHSSQLVRNMSEIIWAMNTRYDTLENLLAYIRRYASEYLEEHVIALDWQQEIMAEGLKLSGEKRRNVFLVCKEALHNITKHAQADKVIISAKFQENLLQISIADNGIGFEFESKKELGNGLFNMQKRMEQVQGSLNIQKQSKGTLLMLQFSIS
ncbi:MAG: hypothetical protein IPO86_01955 [Saprospiraceae bacterium]|nr:hypothetical protein [Saprospiraceae bacterium]